MTKRIGGRKNRWGGLCGPSRWVCRASECPKRNEVVKLDFAATYGTCESCGKGLYRSREET